MIPQETEREVVQDDERNIDTGKIERTAGYSVGLFINRCPQIVPYIQMNDKTPIWDGELFIYENEKNIVENFSARVPLQIKGTTNTKDDSYRIERKYLEGYKNDGACLFFLVHVDENYNPTKILYACLSLEYTKSLLLQRTKTIKIDMKVVSEDPIAFQKEIIIFAEKRKSEKNENSAPKEIETIVNYFKEIRNNVDKIGNEDARRDLKSLFNTITTVRDDGTMGWRDDFIYYSQKAINLVIKYIRDNDFSDLLFEFGLYLHKQKQYELALEYYFMALNLYRERAKGAPSASIKKEAETLNKIGDLYNETQAYELAIYSYNKAQKIYRKLAKDTPDKPDTYMLDLAMTYYDLAVLHKNLYDLNDAEEEFKETLKILLKLTKDNPAAYINEKAMTLNNLAILNASQEDFDKAIDAIDEALALIPDNANFYQVKSLILRMKANREK